MAAARGTEIARSIRQKLDELKGLCQGLDDSAASYAPAGRWSPKEILSHLCGKEGAGHLPIFEAFLDGKREIPFRPGDPFFSEHRRRMSVSEYLTEVEKEYEGIARFTENLSAEQLATKAHVPELKDSRLGEYPTLAEMIRGVAERHLQFHTNHLREVMQEVKAA